MGAFKDLTGQKFGKLTVIKDTGERKWGNVIWECSCECGNKAKVTSNNLQKKTRSCGCSKHRIHFDVTLPKDREIIQKRTKKICDTLSKKYWVGGTDLKQLNEKISVNNSSGTKGVARSKRVQKWIAYIGFQNKSIHLGYFENLEDAAKARKQAEEKYFKPVIEEFKALREVSHGTGS